MTTKKANITIEEYIEMSEVDFNEAVNYEFTSDTCQLANSIYQSLFKFFDKKNFSGDLILATFCYNRGSKNEGVGYGTLVLARFD